MNEIMFPNFQDDLNDLEKHLLELPQVDFELRHFFVPGYYIRLCALHAGTMAMGWRHKQAHLNILLQGKVLFASEYGVKTVEAPLVFVGKDDRKFIQTLTDTIWVNIFQTNETDLDKIETELFDKSHAWLEKHKEDLCLVQL